MFGRTEATAAAHTDNDLIFVFFGSKHCMSAAVTKRIDEQLICDKLTVKNRIF